MKIEYEIQIQIDENQKIILNKQQAEELYELLRQTLKKEVVKKEVKQIELPEPQTFIKKRAVDDLWDKWRDDTGTKIKPMLSYDSSTGDARFDLTKVISLLEGKK